MRLLFQVVVEIDSADRFREWPKIAMVPLKSWAQTLGESSRFSFLDERNQIVLSSQRSLGTIQPPLSSLRKSCGLRLVDCFPNNSAQQNNSCTTKGLKILPLCKAEVQEEKT